MRRRMSTEQPIGLEMCTASGARAIRVFKHTAEVLLMWRRTSSKQVLDLELSLSGRALICPA